MRDPFFVQMYDELAEDYAHQFRAVGPRQRADGRGIALGLLALRAGERLLDVACGPGNLTWPATGQLGAGGLAVGIDASAAMLAHAASGAVGAGSSSARAFEATEDAGPSTRPVFARMAMEALGFRDASFDAVLCCHGLQFSADLAMTLAEVRRVLRPAGRFAASIPCDGPKSPAQTALNDLVHERLGPVTAPAGWRRTSAVVSDLGTLCDALRDAGLEPSDTRRLETVLEREPKDLVAMAMRWWGTRMRLQAQPEVDVVRLAQEATELVTAVAGGVPVEVVSPFLVVLARAGTGAT